MRKPITLLPLVAIAIVAPAHAGEDPLYEPVPDQGAYSELRAELSGPPIILFDEQRRIGNDRLWSYSDRTIRVDNPQMLQNIACT